MVLNEIVSIEVCQLCTISNWKMLTPVNRDCHNILSGGQYWPDMTHLSDNWDNCAQTGKDKCAEGAIYIMVLNFGLHFHN